MPIRFKVSNNKAKPVVFPPKDAKIQTPADLLNGVWGTRDKGNVCAELLQSSVSPSKIGSIQGQRNGFVDTVVQAYNQHHHLSVR